MTQYGRHEGPNFIPSSTQKFYRSDPYVSSPGEPQEIRIKAKMSVGGMCKKQGGGSNFSNIKRPKTKHRDQRRGEQRVLVMYDAIRGKTRIMTASEFAARPYGWEIA
jgi:hypothetical protein